MIRVTVYVDPLTKNMVEGEAKIVRHVREVDDYVNLYVVMFTNDPLEEEYEWIVADRDRVWTVEEILRREG